MVAAPETSVATTNGASRSPKVVANGVESSPSNAQANGHGEHANDEGKAKEANLPPPEIARQIPCRFFPLGTCKYGEQCAFSHSIPIVPASGASMSMPGQGGRGDYSQPMQHPGMMMYYPQQYEGEFNGYPSQFSPPQGFFYPPQYAPYYAPPQPFYPPSAQPTSPNANQAEQSTLQPAPSTGAPSEKADAADASPSAPTEPTSTEQSPTSNESGDVVSTQSIDATAASAQSTSHQADTTAGPSVMPVPTFFQPMAAPYYPVNGRQSNSRMRNNMNGSFNGGRRPFLAPDGTKLPKPSCSFFEANRCRNRDDCPFPHRLADGTDARKLGLGMIGIDGRTEGPEDKGGMPPAWQQAKRQGGGPRSNNATIPREGRSQRSRQEDGVAPAHSSSNAGRKQNASHQSGDSKIALGGRLPPGSSAPSLVAAINGLTRRIPPISNSQAQSRPQQRVPSGDDFPALAGTDKSTTGHITPARQQTRPSSPEPATHTPVKEPWSPEVGRDGAPSSEPSPPQPSEKKASSESGDSDFIIVTANDGQPNETESNAAASPAQEESKEAPSPVATVATMSAPKISFASAAAKGASVPTPIRLASKPRAPVVAASSKDTKSSVPSSAAASSTASSSRSQGKSSQVSTQASSPVATSTASVSKTQDEDDEGFTVATRKERRDHRKNASQSARA